MNTEYYKEYFSRYADSSEEDAVRVNHGAVRMEIVDSICDNTEDKVAHQASVILGFNMYKNNKDAYVQEICYEVCTDECEIQKVVDKCNKIALYGDLDAFEDDLSILVGLFTLTDRQTDSSELGYISDELQRSFLVHDKPDYDQLNSNIDYILYDLLDVLDIVEVKCKEYVYKHREKIIRPIMDLVLSSGDIVLIEQMSKIYTSWIEWR